jgi:hypothetical protein
VTKNEIQKTRTDDHKQASIALLSAKKMLVEINIYNSGFSPQTPNSGGFDFPLSPLKERC